jgi:hypothetical protein
MLVGRILLFGIAWLAAMGLLVTLLHPSPRHIRRVAPVAAASQVTPVLKPGEVPIRYPGWTVTRAISAHHVMVADVETDRPEQARQIAIVLVEPVKSRYEEILIYVRRPGTSGKLAARRMQWTPRGGYVEVVY